MERDKETFSEEWLRFLNELRVVLPGVQLLFAFLLTVPFTSGFTKLGLVARGVFFGCFLSSTAACAFLVAPAVYHRLHWRRDVRDKENMIRLCNRMAIVGGALLALSMTSAVYVLSTILFDPWLGLCATALALFMFGYLWFGLPLSKRSRERRE